jgi:hypothetical protein
MNKKGERVHEIFKGNYFQPLRPDIELLKQKYQSSDFWLIISSEFFECSKKTYLKGWLFTF